MRKLIAVGLVLLVGISCAQVPKESVELSATVGRDLAVVHQAHRDMAIMMFARMKMDVNRFVDEVYAPFQVRFVMNEEWAKAQSADSVVQSTAILLGINSAFAPGADAGLQAAVLEGMSILVDGLRADIESMRKELLDPLDAQESELIGSIDRAYNQLHYANSIVTGHLSSVAEVHETQAELLEAIGVDRDLRQEVGARIASTAGDIENLVGQAQKADMTLDDVSKSAVKLKKFINSLTNATDADTSRVESTTKTAGADSTQATPPRRGREP